MLKAKIVVVRTGTANLASVVAALKRFGAEAELSDKPERIEKAPLLILPGVGTFAAAMKKLETSGLTDILRQRLLDERPTLAVCLGLQLLLEGSEESPGTSGLCVVSGKAAFFPRELRVPQLGWNKVTATAGTRYLEDGYYYFANSYRLAEPPAGWRSAIADYGGPFVAAMERGPVLACQFHPELSGNCGMSLIERWVRLSSGFGGTIC